MTMPETKTRNCSIDIFRYFCAVLVVAIHTHPLYDVRSSLGYVFTSIVPQISVPFFFATAGYFYMGRLENGQTPFRPYIRRLLTTYFLWSCLYFLVDFIQWGHQDLKGFVISCALRFVLKGSHYHFWFFPALMLAVCLATLLYRAGLRRGILALGLALYLIGCLGSAYSFFGLFIPGLNRVYTAPQFDLILKNLLKGFPFFVSGYLVYRLRERLPSALPRPALPAAALFWLTEIILLRTLNGQGSIDLTLGQYPLTVLTLLTLLEFPLPERRELSEKCRALANFTYYAHPLFIMGLSALSTALLHRPLSETPLFLLTAGLSCLTGLVIIKWDKKALNFIIR